VHAVPSEGAPDDGDGIAQAANALRNSQGRRLAEPNADGLGHSAAARFLVVREPERAILLCTTNMWQDFSE
jgi:hypothetical protein